MGVAMTAVTSPYDRTAPIPSIVQKQLHDKMTELIEALRKSLQKKRSEIVEKQVQALSSSSVILATATA